MRRGVRILIVAVVVLAGLFVAADRVALAYAESRAASSVQSSQALAGRPSVSIKGFPFLTQVADRKLDEVTLSARDVETTTGGGDGRLRIARLTADLRGVELAGHFTGFVADSATGTALVSYPDLSAGAPAGVTVSYGGTNAAGRTQVKVTGRVTVPVLGTIERSVTSTVDVTGGDTVSLRAGAIPKIPGLGDFPGLDKLIRSKIDFSRRLSGLPASITLKSVRATPAGIEIVLVGHDVRLNGQ